MKKLISLRVTSNILITFNSLILILHILILLKIFPYSFIWGGQIKNDSDLIRLESISIFVELVFIIIISIKAGLIFKGKFKRIVNIGVWLMFIYMVLNTLGNLVSSSGVETMIMTPLTIILAFLLFRLAIQKEDKDDKTIHH